MRLGLAVLIVGTDLVLARLLGPAAKGRFALVLLYSQLAAMAIGFGMDQAVAIVSGRDPATARRAMGNAIVWTAVVGGFAVVLSAWLYGVPAGGRPNGPLTDLLPNLSAAQFMYAAIAIPGELFFLLGLNVLLGRRAIRGYGLVRLLRRGTLLVVVVALAAIARLNLDVALIVNLGSLVVSAVAIALASRRAEAFGVMPSPPLLGEELRFGSRAILGSVAERLQFRADAFLVNAILGVRATGIYSVTSGLAETLWYIPNALGVVMLSRAVDPSVDAARVASILTRTTLLVSLVMAVPAFVVGPALVDVVYGAPFHEAGLALRLILPGIVAYSIVAVLSEFIIGRGRPGIGTAILLVGLVVNLAANLLLIPRLGIAGAALSSSISYLTSAVLTLLAFRLLSGQSMRETLIIQPADVTRIRSVVSRSRRRSPSEPVSEGPSGAPAPPSRGPADVALAEHDPGDEL